VPHTQHLLRSIPGIGAVSSACLIAYIGDVHRFSTPEKLVAYIGLDCRVHQSGASINGRGYISKKGNRYLRAMLFNAAFYSASQQSGLARLLQKESVRRKTLHERACRSRAKTRAYHLGRVDTRHSVCAAE
jgi:transposase